MKLRGKLPGLNYTPKLRIVYLYTYKYIVVEEHSMVGGSVIERMRGRNRRENAGISSERVVRIHPVESLRFPREGLSA